MADKYETPLHHALAANIRRLAQQRGVTLTQLPFDAQVSPSHFWKILRRDAEPRLSWLLQVAAALEVGVDELVKLSESPAD